MVVFGEFEGWDPALALVCGACCAIPIALFLIVLVVVGIVHFIRRDRRPPDA
jgi:hypothetical protein